MTGAAGRSCRRGALTPRVNTGIMTERAGTPPVNTVRPASPRPPSLGSQNGGPLWVSCLSWPYPYQFRHAALQGPPRRDAPPAICESDRQRHSGCQDREHVPKPKAIGGAAVTDDAMLAVALHLRGQELSLREIADRLGIAAGKKRGGGCGRGPRPACRVAACPRAGPRPRASRHPDHPLQPRPLDRGGGGCGRGRDQFAALLPIRERVLGAEHPHTLSTRDHLARWTGQAGDAAGAPRPVRRAAAHPRAGPRPRAPWHLGYPPRTRLLDQASRLTA